MKLHNKCVLITGAASGMGEQLAMQLSQDEKCVVFAVDQDQINLKRVEVEAAKYNLTIETRLCDVTDFGKSQKVFDKIFAENKVDVWFNNAGILAVGEFTKQSEEQISELIDVNFKAVCHWTMYANKKLLEQGGGTIVNMASLAGICASPYISIYSACKHGVVGLTRSLQEEFKQTNSLVKLVLVAPGFIKTPMSEKEVPESAHWLLASSAKTVKEIIKGLKKDKLEIIPDKSGKLIQLGYRFTPRVLVKATKLYKYIKKAS